MEIGSIGQNFSSYNEIPKKKSEPAEEKSAEKTTISTDEVDKEIEDLKSRRMELKKSLRASGDENLQTELTQVENELRLKDNDEYRKSHAKVFSAVDLKV